MKRLLALLLCVLMVAAMMSGCAKAPEVQESPAKQEESAKAPAAAEKEEVAAEAEEELTGKLIIWSWRNEGEVLGDWLAAVTEEFQAQHPKLDVELLFMTREILTVFQTKLSDTSAKDYPDVIGHFDNMLFPLAEEGVFYCLDEDMTTPAFDSDCAWKDTFNQKLYAQQQVGGKTYMVPDALSTSGIFYDTVLFDKLGLTAPTTWDELMEVCETLKANGIAPFSLDGALDQYNHWWYSRFAERMVGFDTLYKAGCGEVSFKDDPGFLKAAEYVAEFSKRGYFQNGYEGSQFPAAQALFCQGTTGMLLCGSWIPTEMASSIPETMKLSIFSLPELPGSKEARAEEVWSNAFAVTEASDNKAAAVAWMKYFTSKAAASIKPIAELTPLVEMPVPEDRKNVNSILENATSIGPGYANLLNKGDWTNNIYGPLSTQLITGKISPAEFIDELDAQTKAFYNK